MSNDSIVITLAGINDNLKRIVDHCNGCKKFELFQACIMDSKPLGEFMCMREGYSGYIDAHLLAFCPGKVE